MGVSAKPVVDACLLHDSVGGVSRFYFAVNDKSMSVDRTLPDGMVALAAPHDKAAMLQKDPAHFNFEVGH
jgi:hypothetical protein